MAKAANLKKFLVSYACDQAAHMAIYPDTAVGRINAIANAPAKIEFAFNVCRVVYRLAF